MATPRTGSLRWTICALLFLASTINYAPGRTRANSALLLLGTSGNVIVFCEQASGTAHVILDVSGYLE